MPRRKPVSAKQKKATLQEKRAVKRGDAPPPEHEPRQKHGSMRLRGRGGAPGRSPIKPDAVSARKLQSSFVKASPEFLERTKALASSCPLPRPLPAQAAILDGDSIALGGVELEDPSKTSTVVCPKRPKWRFDMTKKEVERNEEGLFKKWIVAADAVVDEWRTSPARELEVSSEESLPLSVIPRAPTQFERNLEVWRQL
jgi:hypothetical protein